MLVQEREKFAKRTVNIKNFNTVKLITDPLENLPTLDLGYFDYTLAIAVLYWVGRKDYPHYCKANRDREIRFIEKLCLITDNIFIRARGTQYNNYDYYKEIFERNGFKAVKYIKEKGKKNDHQIFSLTKIK